MHFETSPWETGEDLKQEAMEIVIEFKLKLSTI